MLTEDDWDQSRRTIMDKDYTRGVSSRRALSMAKSYGVRVPESFWGEVYLTIMEKMIASCSLSLGEDSEVEQKHRQRIVDAIADLATRSCKAWGKALRERDADVPSIS